MIISPRFWTAAAVAVAAACLGLIGISWGLPYTGQPVSLHPDEPLMLAAAVHADVLRGQTDTGLYNYGTGYLYAWSVVIHILDAWGLLGSDPRALYILGRMLSLLAFSGIATALYLTATRHFGAACGLFAAAAWMCAPLAVANAHYATTDMTATFWVIICLCVCTHSTSETPYRQRLLYWAAVSAGFAAACRYNAGLAILAPLLLAVTQSRCTRERLLLFMGLILVCGVSFLMLCPAPLIHTASWWRDLQFELTHVRAGHGHLFTHTGNGLAYHLIRNLAEPQGWALVVMGFAGLIRRVDRTLPWLLIATALLALHGTAAVRFARYMLPMVPILAFGSAAALHVVLQKLDASRPGRPIRLLFAALAMACLAWPARVSAAWLIALVSPDSRVLAASYIKRLPSNASIGAATTPWFHSPALSPAFGQVHSRARRAAAQSLTPRWVVSETEWDTSVLTSEYVCLSDVETEDALRVGHQPAVAFLRELDRSYARVNVWAPLHYELLHTLPHDLRYPFVRVTLYRQRHLP